MNPSGREKAGGEPLIAVICSAPLLGEALSSAFSNIADVRQFPAGRGDTSGLLRSVRPDAIIVDTQDEADEAESFASESRSPLVHIALRERKLRLLRDGAWEEPEDGDTSPLAIRNILVASIFGRRARP